MKTVLTAVLNDEGAFFNIDLYMLETRCLTGPMRAELTDAGEFGRSVSFQLALGWYVEKISVVRLLMNLTR